MADEPSISETVDPNGTRVVLTDTVWCGKIMLDHQEIAAYRAEVLRTVAAPDHVVPDPNFGGVRATTPTGLGLAVGCWQS
jgi:hypothetical protein